MIPADKYTPVDAGLIPTGVLAPVEGTPFDFRKATVIGARIHDDNEQLKIAGGYDHNWVLRGAERRGEDCGAGLRSGERACADGDDDGAGRAVLFREFLWMERSTARRREGYAKNTGLCLETQHFPDSPNHPCVSDDAAEAGRDAA